MTSEQIAELRSLEQAASSAPWTVEDEYEVTGYVPPTNDYQHRAAAGKPGYPCAVVQGGEQRGDPAVSAEDAAFIAAARNALRRLLDEREALLNALRAWVGPDDDDPEDRNWHHVNERGEHFFMDGYSGGKSPEECPVCLSRAAMAAAEAHW